MVVVFEGAMWGAMVKECARIKIACLPASPAVLSHCHSTARCHDCAVQVVLRQLSLELMRKLGDELKHSTAESAAFYEHRLQEGQKPIFHLEAFLARFMSNYKQVGGHPGPIELAVHHPLSWTSLACCLI